MIYDCLGDVDEKGEPVPGIAKWDISKDGLTYTFHIKDNIKFSNGTSLTADDVAFTFTYLCDKSYNGSFDPSAINIKGWKAYHDGTAKDIEGIKVKDKHTVSFELEKQNTSAIYTLARTLIMPKDYYGKNYKQGDTSSLNALQDKPIGSGQYVFKDCKPGEEYDFEANSNYWRGKSKIKKVILKVTDQSNKMQLLKNGGVDIDIVTPNDESVDAIKNFKFVNLRVFPSNTYGYIDLNLKKDIFKDKKVRQALTYGLDREDLIKTTFGKYGQVCNEPQSTASWNYNSDVNKYKFDTKKANELFDEAGWKKGADGIRSKDGKKFEFHYLASTDNPVNEVLIPIMKENYKKLGIQVIVDSMEFETIQNKIKNGDYDMSFVCGSLGANPDQSTVFKTNGAQNYSGYSNKKLDKEMDNALEDEKFDSRKKDYQNVWKTVNDDLPQIFIYQRNDMWAISSRVSGIDITPYKDFTASLWKAKLK
ncbi:ABC transporter substrate-binding protein [Clostridium sp. CT7]|nr:ABC transporter substrate-binding protein [Clostridium sp. CT7]